MERTRTREPALTPKEKMGYTVITGGWKVRHDRADHGEILVKQKEQPIEINPQGQCYFWAHPGLTERATVDWDIFTNEIHTHSGLHVHQGGLVLFVIDGRGYTTIDGEAVHWKKGDLILLPIQPGGVAHQHFNIVDEEPSTWIAFIYEPWINAMGNTFEQRDLHPEYRD